MASLRFSRPATKMIALPLMNERYIEWYMPWLNREFEMLVFGGGLAAHSFPELLCQLSSKRLARRAAELSVGLGIFLYR